MITLFAVNTSGTSTGTDLSAGSTSFAELPDADASEIGKEMVNQFILEAEVHTAPVSKSILLNITVVFYTK